MRLFIGINISEEVKEEAVKIQEKIKKLGELTLVPKENLHITLKFLGEIEDSEKIIKKLNNIKFEQFSLKATNIGFFPNNNYIKVVWIGFVGNEILALQKQIDKTLEEDFKKEKNFVTHATIARVKYLSPEDKTEMNELKTISLRSSEFKVNSFKLMKSTLTSNGPAYETLRTFKTKAL